VIGTLEERKVGFRSLQESIDTTSPGGRLVFHIFGALSEFERGLIRERTQAATLQTDTWPSFFRRGAVTTGFLSIPGTRRLQLRARKRIIFVVMIDISVGSLTAVLNKEEDLFDAALGAIRFAERK
jgi:hypothetical protein